MDLQIALLLSQDGIVNGAIYALLALALVLGELAAIALALFSGLSWPLMQTPR